MTTRSRGVGAPPGRKIPGPVYPLGTLVFSIAIVGRKRASREVVERLGVGEPRAEAYIRENLSLLDAGNYECTREMEWECGDGTKKVTADVYGLRNEDGDWYVKFYVEHGRVIVASFHEPEFNMRCASGLELKGWR